MRKRTEPAVEIDDLWLVIHNTPVLEEVSLRVESGEFLGLIGPNGAGKTMLLRVMMGLIRPTRGTVRVLGDLPERTRANIGYVPQHSRLPLGFPMRVLDFVLMSRLGRDRLLRPFRQQDRSIAHEALARVDAEELADEQVTRLSGGQFQRVLLARSLAVSARLLILDEPTASLDPRSAQELYELLARLSPPLTVILVSHDIGVISSRVRSVACLNRRLHYHPSQEITHEMLEKTYGAHTDLVIHRHSHRILQGHPRPERD